VLESPLLRSQEKEVRTLVTRDEIRALPEDGRETTRYNSDLPEKQLCTCVRARRRRY